jgi:hypothetical protein
MDSILQHVVDLVHWAVNEKGEQMPRAQEKVFLAVEIPFAFN